MIGLVIASHGRLGEELLATAREIVGELPAAVSCSVAPGTSADELRSTIRAAVQAVDQGDGVIVFADLVGGSPCTQSLMLCQQARLEVVTGFNLPMVLKANSLRGTRRPLAELACELASYGQRAITCPTEQLRRAAG
ncbi:MAG: PTS mannose transporter subunit IID [Archangium sp.]|nr:PTS mannose transporter subunit IID [Archangium sp.]